MQIALFCQNCSLPFSLSMDIPALLKSWQKHYRTLHSSLVSQQCRITEHGHLWSDKFYFYHLGMFSHLWSSSCVTDPHQSSSSFQMNRLEDLGHMTAFLHNILDSLIRLQPPILDAQMTHLAVRLLSLCPDLLSHGVEIGPTLCMLNCLAETAPNVSEWFLVEDLTL
jgi:hypothetical protein